MTFEAHVFGERVGAGGADVATAMTQVALAGVGVLGGALWRGAHAGNVAHAAADVAFALDALRPRVRFTVARALVRRLPRRHGVFPFGGRHVALCRHASCALCL